MTAPTLSRERAVEIAEERFNKQFPENSPIKREWFGEWIIAAIHDAFAEGVAQGEADRRDAARFHMLKRCGLLAESESRLDAMIAKDAALAQTKQEPQT